MAREIMRHAKIKMAGVGQVEKHNNLSREQAAQNQKHDIELQGYSNIELDNMQYNKNIVECHGFRDRIQSELDKYGIRPRKDAVALIEGVYTFSPEFCPNLVCYLHRRNEEWKNRNKSLWSQYEGIEKAREEYSMVMNYFKACVEHENRHYGVCINAMVHFHEGTPHLHTDTIPLIRDLEKKKVRLSAKDVIGNKTKMSTLQTAFHEEVGKEFGLERGEIRETKTVKKHLSKEQEALKKAQEDLQKALEEKKQVQSNLYELEELYVGMESRLEELQKQIKLERQVKDDIEKMLTKLAPALETFPIEQRIRGMEKIKAINKEHDKIKKLIEEQSRIPSREVLFGKSFQESADRIHEEVEELEEDLDGWEME